jgi:hypothetical protein
MMSESEEVHERTMELRDEFELVDASLKRNMLLQKQLFYFNNDICSTPLL